MTKTTLPRYAIGQPVKCAMYDGVWAVTKFWKVDYNVVKCFRYEIRQGDEYQGNIPEVWLEPVRIKRPQMQLVR